MSEYTLSLLWTDYFIWALVLAVLTMTIYIATQPHLRLAWQQVFMRPLSLFAAIVLFVFITIGLMDSLHFKVSHGEGNGVEHSSVLDMAMQPVIDGAESSYSAPFALVAFSKENVEQADGSVIRDYPRLVFGGAHLESDSQRLGDIRSRVFQASAQAFIIWGAVAFLICGVCCWRSKMGFESFVAKVIKGEHAFPYRTFLFSILLLLVLYLVIGALIPYYHIFGTSKIGEDVFYQAMKSIRTGLVIGTLTTLFMLPLAISLGMMAGYFRGVIDDIIQYLYTTLSSIPGVLLIAAAVLSLQVLMSQYESMFQSQAMRSDARLLALCFILGITSWTGLCRLLRAEVLKLRDIEFVQAAKVLSVGSRKILSRHMLPNIAHIILISIALDFSGLVLAEAVLSYVGVGVDPASYSWGTMINGARLELARAPIVWWSLMASFVFMFTLVLAANIFADAVRDAFDPRVTT